MATLDVLIWAHASRIVICSFIFQIAQVFLIWGGQTVGLLCVLAGHQIVIAALNSLQLSARQKQGTVWRRGF